MSSSTSTSFLGSDMPEPSLDSTGSASSATDKPKRNFQLDQISNAVEAVDGDSFNRSSFALKRTRSMGLLDSYIVRPSTDLTGSINDYPHLAVADNSLGLNSDSASINNLQQSSTTPPPPQYSSTQIPSSAASDSSVSTASSLSATTSSPTSSVNSIYHQPPPPQNIPSKPSNSTSNTPSSSSNSTITNDPPSSSPQTSLNGTPDLTAVHDDSVLAYEPQCHVDYLSHDWKESDISTCWRNIVSRRRDVANSARLENASWRTWTKAKYNLKTVSPESVNWLKDCDITWLYGPLYNQPMNIHYTDPRNDSLDKNDNNNPSLLSDSESGNSSSAGINNTTSFSSSATITPNSVAAATSATPISNNINNATSTSSRATTNNTTPTTTASSTATSAATESIDSLPIHKPILKKRTVSDKLFARQNSGHHTPTVSGSHQHSSSHNEDSSKTESSVIPSAGSKDDLHKPPSDRDSSRFDAEDPMYHDGVSYYLRHHNYRHRPHTGHSDEKLSRQLNLQYRHVPGHLNSRTNSSSTGASATVHSPGSIFSGTSASHTPSSAPGSARHGPTSQSADGSTSPVSLLETSEKSSVASFRPLERHIHFNDRVEQCIAVDTYGPSSTDTDSDNDDSYRNNRFRRNWRPLDSRSSESDSDEDSGSDSGEDDEEEEPGLFLSLRSCSSTSLNRMDRFASMTSTSQYKTIAPLPATTLRAAYDDAENEERHAIESNSVAYAMSHNTQPRTHIYSVYDYNSVYQAPVLPQYDALAPGASTTAGPHHTSSAPEIIEASQQSSLNVKTIDPSQIMGPSNMLKNKSNSSIELGRHAVSKTTGIIAAANNNANSNVNNNNTDDDDDDTVLALPSHLSAQIAMGSNGSYIPTSISTGSLKSFGPKEFSVNSAGSFQRVSSAMSASLQSSNHASSASKIKGGFQMGGDDSDGDSEDSDGDRPMTFSHSGLKVGSNNSSDAQGDVIMKDVSRGNNVSSVPSTSTSGTNIFGFKASFSSSSSSSSSSLARSSSSSTNLAAAGGFGNSSSAFGSSSSKSNSAFGRSSSTNLANMMNSAGIQGRQGHQG